MNGCLSPRVGAVKPSLSQLNVVVAEFKPNELVQLTRRLTELKTLKIVRDSVNPISQPLNNPAVGKFQIVACRREGRLEALKIHQQKSRRVPNFIGEVAGGFDA